MDTFSQEAAQNIQAAFTLSYRRQTEGKVGRRLAGRIKTMSQRLQAVAGAVATAEPVSGGRSGDPRRCFVLRRGLVQCKEIMPRWSDRQQLHPFPSIFQSRCLRRGWPPPASSQRTSSDRELGAGCLAAIQSVPGDP